VSAAAASPGVPESAFQVRLGWFFPSGGSDLWDVNEDAFTYDDSDFDSGVFGMTFVQSVSNQFEVGVNLDFYGDTVFASQRGFTDDFGNPVFHDTEISSVPFTVDVRFVPGGRYRMRPGGRKVLKPVFYVGAGVGITFWSWEEVGDFVFEDDLGFFVSYDRFKETGEALEVHGLAGVELPVGSRFSLVFEGRYSKADDDLSFEDAYNGPGTLELGGTSVYCGGSWRF
jgi:hypothetical protein